jgi:DNA-binding PadR family transcriptional regulator
MSDERLSELESCVLAVIGRDGPCTRYHVMRIFAGSQTSRWSSTAGSIYPLVARMTKKGMVRNISDKRGEVALTGAGRRVVEEWLVSDAEKLGGPIDDPIRTRSYFISALDEDAQAIAVGRWREATQLEIAEGERRKAEFERVGDHAQARAHSGILRQLRARLEWLNEDF